MENEIRLILTKVEMETKEFKQLISSLMKEYGFTYAYSGWYKQVGDFILSANLQRSYYSVLYYLNLKIWKQGLFGINYKIDKSFIINNYGLTTRPPKEYAFLFDLEYDIPDDVRKELLIKMFKAFICPFVELSFSFEGIIELEKRDWIFILPSWKEYM